LCDDNKGIGVIEYGRLIYKRRGEEGAKSYTLRIGSNTLGRDEGNDVPLDAEGISRYHARVICTPAGCTITDLGSTNGTFLNQVRLAANTPQQLRHGDTLRIGVFAVRYHNPASVEAQPVPAATGTTEPSPVLPPEVAAQLPRKSRAPFGGRATRRLPGNGGGPPRILPPGPRLGDDGYMRYLPPAYHDQDLLRRLLLVFQSIMDPLDRTIEQLHYYFDPRLTPETFLPWLASWLDLALNEKWPIERRRMLVLSGPQLYRRRGTLGGLRDYIQICTGVAPEIDEPGRKPQSGNITPLDPHVFRVTLRVAEPDLFDRTLIEEIIEAEKPAHTAYLLEILPLATAAG
jgi:phage tail-like protein